MKLTLTQLSFSGVITEAELAMDVPGVEDDEGAPAEVVMDVPGVEDGGGAPGVVVLAGGVLVDVWEVCTTGDIVLDDPTFVVWSGVAEGLIFEGEGATVVVLWPETVSAIIAHVHDL